MRVLELFGGIGACTKALKKKPNKFELADYVEIDKYAVGSFNAINGTNFKAQDVCEWDKDVDVDLIMHGSPCQDFSIYAGQKGGDKGSGTRSSLMYETVRIVEKLKPKYVIWENVKNILSGKHKHNFSVYLKTLEDLGYRNYYKVLNAKDYLIPQTRPRVLTVSIRNDIEKVFEFPAAQPLNLKLKDMLDAEVEEKYYIRDGILNNIDSPNQAGYLSGGRWDKINWNCRRYYKEDGLCPTITTCPGGNTQPKVLTRDKNNELCVRKLTPRECWRLMGFSDSDFEKAAKINSSTQLYKQAGNSIVVTVLEHIFDKLFED